MSYDQAQTFVRSFLVFVWAVAAATAIVVVMTRTGLLSPDDLLPEKCEFQGLKCEKAEIGQSSLKLSLANNGARIKLIKSITASSDALGATGTGKTAPLNLGCTCSTGPIEVMLKYGETKDFVLNLPDNSTECAMQGTISYCNFRDTGKFKNRYNITLSYQWAGSTITHESKGELLIRRII